MLYVDAIPREAVVFTFGRISNCKDTSLPSVVLFNIYLSLFFLFHLGREADDYCVTSSYIYNKVKK